MTWEESTSQGYQVRGLVDKKGALRIGHKDQDTGTGGSADN